MNKLSLGFSPCPNDTYIFDALVNHKIEHSFDFQLFLEDVETLNKWSMKRVLDISKISIHAFFHVLENYTLLSSGAALGRGCGPLVIQKGKGPVRSGKIALPGKFTTASLLFDMAIQGDFQYVYMPFDKIIPAVLQDEVDAGIIIHESRFTYQEVGLHCWLDLGKWWEEETGSLIPLGAIMIAKDMDKKIQSDLERLIRLSLNFADNAPTMPKFVLENAQEMDLNVLKNHIHLYVNQYSRELGDEGKNAIQQLYLKSSEMGLIPKTSSGFEDQLFCS